MTFDHTSNLYGDRGLLASLREGDERAFNRLVELYGGALIAHAHRILGNVDLGREIVQDVFFSLWRHRDRIEMSWDIRAYLYGLTRQRSIDALRAERSSNQREYRWVTQQVVDSQSTTIAKDTSEDAEETRQVVWNALLELSPRCREVFVLVMDHQLGYPEIARRLGVAETTVRRHMSRALEHLAEILEPRLSSE